MMAKQDPGRSVKDKTLYERLCGAGVSKGRAAITRTQLIKALRAS